MAKWRYVFCFIFIANVGVGVPLTNHLFKEVFLKQKPNEHICAIEPDTSEKSLDKNNFEQLNLEDSKVLKNDEEEIPKTEKNVLDTLKVILKKRKSEVVQETNKHSDNEGKDPPNQHHIQHVDSVPDPPKERGKEADKWEHVVGDSLTNPTIEKRPSVKRKAKESFNPPQSSTLNMYGQVFLSEPKQRVSKEEVDVSDGARSEENQLLDRSLTATDKQTEDKERKTLPATDKQTEHEEMKTHQASEAKSLDQGLTDTEAVNESLGTTPQAQNFVERPAPWKAPKPSRNLSDQIPSDKEEQTEGLPQDGEVALLTQSEESAKLEEEIASPGNETEESSQVAQIPEGNVTTDPEVDSATERATPPEETPDDAQKDQLETYSQFAERVTAEKKNGASASNGGTGNGQLVKGPKVKTKNYASTDCGAKFLAANPESSHSHMIINSNKDEYMLNKCTGKIWAIVELCEIIRPQKFDIANFELFSNSPKDIYLFGNHRYPTREWASLGAYKGQEGNREVQSFNVETQEFFKFIKLEVHSYYGTEFFCPLSQFKIYGLSEFEVIEETEDAEEDPVIEEEEVLEEPKVEETKDKRGMIPDVIKSVVSGMFEVIKRGSRSGNRTDEPELNTFTQNCRSLHANFSIGEEMCPFAESLNYILACYYDEYRKLIARPFIASVVNNNDFCRRLATVVCASPKTDDRLVYDSLCNNSYACVMLSPKHVLAMCHMQDPSALRDAVECASSKGEIPEPAPKNLSLQASSSDQVGTRDLLPHEDVTLEQPVRTTIEKEGSQESPLPSDQMTPQTRSGDEAKENVIHLPHIDSEPKAPKDQVNKGKDTQSPIPESTPNATIVSAASDKVVVHKPDKKERKGEKESEEKTSMSDDTHPMTQGNSPSTATPPTASSESRVGSHSNKESVVVRLSNKIKVLEHNMSISSQYLEELSRRYKRQMEDMQRQFNITILALNSTSQTAYERDLYHQKRLEALENQVEKMVKLVTVLVEEKDNLLTRVVEQHMILLFVEVVVMFLIFSFCLRRRKDEAPRSAVSTIAAGKVGFESRWEEGSSLLQPEADPQGRETPSLCRRRSVDSIRSENETKPKERRLSGDLAMTGSYKDLLITLTTTKEKKRKKKKTHLERSLSNASISEKDRPTAPTKKEKKLEKLKRSSAGVLFSGEKGKEEECGSKKYNSNVMKEVNSDEWQVVKKGKGKNKIEAATSPYLEEPYVLSSDLKRGKIILDQSGPMESMYPQQYYTEMPFDHRAVYNRESFDIEYKDISIYDYNSELDVNSAGHSSFSDVYLAELDYGGPVVSDYYSVGEGPSYHSRKVDSAKNGSRLEDTVDDPSVWKTTKSPKLLAKARSCTEFRSPGVTSSFKGRTKLRSDNWEWYSSQPSRLLSSCNSAAEVVSNSSSDSSVKSKALISESKKETLKLEKKKKKKNKGTKLTNGENR